MKGFLPHSFKTNGLLPEREVCTVKYQTEVFSMDRATKERGPCKKQRSDISQYTDRTSEANNRFIIWLN